MCEVGSTGHSLVYSRKCILDFKVRFPYIIQQSVPV